MVFSYFLGVVSPRGNTTYFFLYLFGIIKYCLYLCGMISYKYKLYRTPKTKHLDKMLREACFVWNHALALQKRYYQIYHKYIDIIKIRSHFAKRIRRNKVKDFTSFVFRQTGYSLNGNVLTINRIKKNFKFSLSRPYDGNIKNITIYRSPLGEFFIILVLDKPIQPIGKTHNGASVGIDFGLKTYLTLSDGTIYDNPLFMKEGLIEMRRLSRNLSKCENGSSNKERKRKELDRHWNDITNKHNDFQWKLAHELCRKYDKIFIEDLDLADMKLGHKANRKLKDQAHAEFITKLLYVATKYDVVVHKIDRYYPSSKTCTCGYVNSELKLSDRKWVCPHCGATHDRDLLAANNILRRGIYELESDSKTSKHTAKRLSRLHPRISLL